MMRSKFIFSILIIILLYVNISIAQNKDTELWSELDLTYNISERTSLTLEQQARFDDNISAYNFTYTEIGLKIGLSDGIALSGKYRYSFIEQEGTGSAIDEYDRYMYSFDLFAKTGLSRYPVEFTYRGRLQESREKTTDNEYSFIRNRFRLKYKWDLPVFPYITYESFFRLNKLNRFDRNRYTTGFDWKIAEKLNLLTFYRLQKEIKCTDPRIQNIIGLSLNYCIN